ncbi:p21-activated protein kinase-interacting protein 1-like [Nilaparvata lugens]|uniref:p21-activated protein kinase-interacting protein 1-like n=1 Tax=Nilaparvata lugens TaxID=108931 RepID=UPI00193CD7D4|nr:p21-activated protein kinase-interacting protein 1-like [Nilaparvata lugens]XP_039284813.1 p21-activated protein kinase-interacting protein 1-like [Nilaparvata lugens]
MGFKFEAIIGTYEQFLVGYKLRKVDGERKFVQSFANHSHQGSVKSIAISGKWLASSGSDEVIHIYDMQERKQSGTLMKQNGSVNSIAFTPDTSYLLSASEDGSIAIFKTGSWHMEKLLKKAHDGEGVTALAVHPSGKMALSLGKDVTLKTWNLVKGRSAYTTNLARSGCRLLDLLVWSPDGCHYAVPMNNLVDVFSVAVAGVTHTFHLKKKVTAITFLNDKVVCIGEEDGSLSAHSLQTGLECWRVVVDKRVRGLAMHEQRYLVAACSGGSIAAYKLTAPAEEPTLVATVDTGCRITCLALSSNTSRKIKEEKEDSSMLGEEVSEVVVANGSGKRRGSDSDQHKSPPKKKKKNLNNKKAKLSSSNWTVTPSTST